MKVTYIWRYLEDGSVSHAVDEGQLPEFPAIAAICGKSPLWFLGERFGWRSNKDELTKRPRCKNCTSYLDKKKGESTDGSGNGEASPNA